MCVLHTVKSWQPFEANTFYSFVFAPLIIVQNYGLVMSQWPWPLTYDLQNQINSSMSHSGPLYQTGTNSIKVFPEYLQAKYKHLAAVTLPFDLWPPKSIQVMLESKWTFIPNLKNLPQGVSKILCSKMWPRQTWHHSDLDLWPPKSNKFILELQWTLLQSLKKIPQSVLEISCSWEIRTDNPKTKSHIKIGAQSWERAESCRIYPS